MANNKNLIALADQLAAILQVVYRTQKKALAAMPKEILQFHDKLRSREYSDRGNRGLKYPLFYNISYQLYQKDSLTMGELSQALAVPMSTATGMVDWMVKEGYTARLPDPADRRKVRVSLTDTGKNLYEALRGNMIRHIERFLSCLTEEEQATMVTLFHKIATNTKDAEE